MVPWSQAIRFSYILTIIGITWASVTAIYTPTLFFWLLPVFSGLIFAAPIIRLSSSNSFGLWCKRNGIFLLDTECKPNHAIRSVNRSMKHLKPTTNLALAPELPKESWSDMPLQLLSRGIYQNQTFSHKVGDNVSSVKQKS